MAAANESQGLKIAVAAFVSLTVILAVTSYFLYSNYSQTFEQLNAARDKESKAQTALSNAIGERDEMRKLIGSRTEETEAARNEIKAEQKKVDEKIAGIPQRVDAAVAKAQAAGVTGPEVQETRDTIRRLVQEYQSEPNKSYISSLSRAADIFDNYSALNASLATNYTNLKRTLEAANSVNKTQTDALAKGLADKTTELTNENKSHVDARADLVNKVDQYQTELAKQATEIANLNTKMTQMKDEFDKRHSLDQELLREYRDRLERDENVLDVPDGRVTFVDYTRNELRTNINRSMGARPQMVMSIFDRNAPGIPTEKPKGTIELIQVGDRYSVARIVKTNVPTDPIRVGDLVHSSAWSPNEPMLFALIGKIDINRDGKDDREDLKRMIRAAGGEVDYDLPPPEAGKESGKLTARDAWYVIDDRPPLREYAGQMKETTPEMGEFAQKKSAAIREARLNGVRPMKIERLLSYLGYDFAAPVTGRPEAYDTASMKMLLRARQGEGQAKSAQPKTEEEPKAETPKAETPKDEKPEEMPKEKEEKPEAEPK
jgi:hypothetical protein